MPSTAATACGTGAQGNVFAAGNAWANPSRITADDASSATVTIGSGAGTKSNSLEATNFGFALPASSSVVGIVVDVKQMQGVHIGTGCFDSSVLLIKTGSDIGGCTNQATNGSLDGILLFRTYGSAVDAWGLTLTETDVNDATFGVDWRSDNNDGNTGASVDFVQMTIYYTGTDFAPLVRCVTAAQAFDARMFTE